ILTEHEDWCDDPKEPGQKGCAVPLANSLAAALGQLRQLYGADMAQWRGGRAHVAMFANPVFSRIPVLRDWLDISIPTSGAYDTLNRGPSTIPDDCHPYEQRFGPSPRIITGPGAPHHALMT